MDKPQQGDRGASRGMVAPAETILEGKLHPKIAQFIRYWLEISPEGLLPGRQHLDPAAISPLLPNLWIIDVERQAEGAGALRFRYRLIGTSVARAFGKDLTGRYLDEAHEGFALSAIHGYLSEVVEKRLPSWRAGKPQFFALRDFLRLERVYLPGARDGATVDMIFAMTVFFDRLGREF
jgi:hypothetical protein